jgi:hypothetical protein
MGIVMGLVVALVPSCGKKCGPENCTGCCNAKNECSMVISDSSCGTAGALCSACPEGQLCEAGACKAPVIDSGIPDSGAIDAGFDAGPPPCKSDFDCVAREPGSVCRAGMCVMGTGCTDDSTCAPDDPEDPCYYLGRQCICDTRNPASGNTGTCRVRRGACEECQTDRECGSDPIQFTPPGKCVALTGDASGKKYCLYRQLGQCGCGTVNDGTGYCKPQTNSCSQVGCNVDKDCASGSVCTVSQPDAGAGSCGGVCVPRCRWNFAPPTPGLVAPGCPANQTCWVDSANLDPTSKFYGAGRCRPACTGDAECLKTAGNPFGGANLKCGGEDLAGGGKSAKRCRANGDCMDNEECPVLPQNQPNVGYCDRGTFACKQDCRTGADPVSGAAFDDCRVPYACKSTDAGVRTCQLKTCVEQGGGAVACSTGEYCCGEDKNSDGVADPCPPPQERNNAGCYRAPSPPYCSMCMNDDECKNTQLPSWLSGTNACANGSKSPACSPLPPKCLQIPKPDGSQGVNVCAPSTNNDVRLDVNNRPKSSLGCPTTFKVEWIRPNVGGDGQEKFCTSNDDCNQGTDAGSCETDTEIKLMDGGFGQSCKCIVGAPNQCPNGPPDSGMSLRSQCKSGVSGQRNYCIESVVCVPRGTYVYTPDSGCGFQ